MRAKKQPEKDAARRRVASPPEQAAVVAQPVAGSTSPRTIAALQSSAGNAGVVQMLRRAGHLPEQERHQHGAGCGHGAEQPDVQRSPVHDVLRSAGRPLDEPLRNEMETRLGADFSDVRVHTDAVAQRSTAELGAKAWTSGNDIAIGPDGADPHTLAHELTHVMQQRAGSVDGTTGPGGVRVSDPGDRFERAAEANAARVMSAPLPDVQRAAEEDTRQAPAAAGTPVQLARHATGPTERDPDSDNYDSDDDNFSTRFESQLPQPTPDATVAGLVEQQSDQHVILWRGTTLSRAEAMEANGSAGGGSANASTSAPDRAASQSQIGHGGQLPEFTARTGIAEGFSYKQALVVVSIAAKYLSRGSSAEDGWTALPSAPLTVLHLVDRTRGQQSGRTANAS
ncbi:eCIS core domain-containing protein [Streptomyces xinghaiensis]|uniref:eCIS core domain-containing protein n=1 Tax=Streptomyces xinghaiensis TaxID=1038928 RepID=UPI00341E2ED9